MGEMYWDMPCRTGNSEHKIYIKKIKTVGKKTQKKKNTKKIKYAIFVCPFKC